uniref:carboxymuconolactone decarboxylase family protein n=1 Tax=Peribacillus sp. FSL E2-0159 TaxID=2975289 RepID=UPI00406CFA4B
MYQTVGTSGRKNKKYCIDIHTKAAKKAKATREEVAESIMVATALKAGSALSHGVNALVAYDE